MTRRRPSGLSTLWAAWLALLLGVGSARPDESGPLSADQLAALDGIARDRFAIRWAELGTNGLAALQSRAAAHEEALRGRHLPHGLVVSLRHEAPGSDRVAALAELDLSSGWTGFLLASTAYRFSVTRDPSALSDVRRILDGVERLLEVSGRPGFVAAYAGPASDPAYRAAYSVHGGPDPSRPGMGRLAFRGEGEATDTVWLAGTDARNLAGLNFGLAMAYWRIREPVIRGRISNAVVRVVGRLEADSWRIRDGRTPDAFVGTILSAAVLRTAATVDFRRYNAEYELRARRVQELDPPGAPPFGDLHETAFTVGSLLALSGLETNTTRRLVYQQHLKELWRSASSQLNPWYAAAYVNCFDEPPRDVVARATLQGVLAQFPDPPRTSPRVDLLADASRGRIEANGHVWLDLPAQLPDRPVRAFQWAWSACIPSGGDGPEVVHPGVDFLLPFWMGRDAGLIPTPDALPAEVVDLRDRFRRTAPRDRSTGAAGRSP